MTTNISLAKTSSPTAHVVTIEDVQFLFSYETCVAFRDGYTPWVVSENVWSRATGGHIMSTTGVKPADRLPRASFLAALSKIGIEVEK